MTPQTIKDIARALLSDAADSQGVVSVDLKVTPHNGRVIVTRKLAPVVDVFDLYDGADYMGGKR
jgi:hypothetical protein